MTEQKQQIEKLVERAAGAVSADDAMKYSQAAANAANALCALHHALANRAG